MQSKDNTNFRPLSLLNVEGKIFFGVLACRMTNFLMSNHYINTPVQKAWIPVFPVCIEHSRMIWNVTLSTKRDKTELQVIWLDLANAYGSVPHHFIGYVNSSTYLICSLCNIGPKYVVCERKEFALKTRNLRKKNSSRFYSWGLQRAVI